MTKTYADQRLSKEDIVDGDTIKPTVDLGFSVHHKVILRLARINAPELKDPGGKESKNFLLELTRDASIRLDVVGRDKYGRYIAEAYANGKNVSDELIKSGHAKPYV